MAIDGERFVADGERVRIPACVRVIAVSMVVAACSPPSPGEDKTPGPPVRALDERAAIEVVSAAELKILGALATSPRVMDVPRTP